MISWMIARQVRRESVFLFFGDIAFFILALVLTLLVRFLTWPSWTLFSAHLGPFSIIFAVWLLVFFIADLYNRRPPARLPAGEATLANVVINVQLVNSFLALAFFYLIPYFVITPKLTLFVDLIFSLALVLWWRLGLSRFLDRGRAERYLFLDRSEAAAEIKRVLTESDRYRIVVADKILPPTLWHREKIAVAVVSPDQLVSKLGLNFYQLMFAGVRFVNVRELYEDIFGRIPLAAVDENWLITHADSASLIYRLLKRLMDLIIAAVLGLVTLPLYLIIAPLIKLSDGGPVFYLEERVGQFGRVFKIRKFRSMSTESALADRRVTPFGRLLRRSRFDELPELWSVLVGDQSLIGPRPERPEYVRIYEREIPYYHARHLIPPGLSGWAQIYHRGHPHFRPEAGATREKLSYDLYYVKNRSFWLDLKIVLKTIRILLSRSGV